MGLCVEFEVLWNRLVWLGGVRCVRLCVTVHLLRDDGVVVLQDDPFDVVRPQLLLLQVPSLGVTRTHRGQTGRGT